MSFLRHKILQVHSTNLYDNLPDEEVVRRDGKIYFVQVRAYIPMAEVTRLCTLYDIRPEKMDSTVHRLLEGAFEDLGVRSRGVSFWREV